MSDEIVHFRSFADQGLGPRGFITGKLDSTKAKTHFMFDGGTGSLKLEELDVPIEPESEVEELRERLVVG
jgi:hypothetical protein